MRSRFSIVLILATITNVARCQSFPDEASLPGCGETCLDAVVKDASTLGCADGSVGCLCAATDFQNGVRDCASANCAADLFPSVTNYLASVCATAVPGVATPTSPAETSPATSTSVPATSAPAALPQSAPLVSTTSSFVDAAVPTSTTSSVVAQSTTSSPAVFVSSTTSSTPGAASTPAPSSSLGTSSSSVGAAGGALVTASSSQSSLGAGAGATSTSASQSSSTASATPSASAAPALSAGAKAGIGIGAALGAVAAIGALVACIISRKHKSHQEQVSSRPFEISEPMPGAGRVYANENSSQGFEPVSELDMKSRRYEDMMPRHVPRNMV